MNHEEIDREIHPDQERVRAALEHEMREDYDAAVNRVHADIKARSPARVIIGDSHPSIALVAKRLQAALDRTDPFTTPDITISRAGIELILRALEPSARQCNQAMNDAEIEREIQSKGLTAPRITPEQIDSVIAYEQYHVFPGSCLTVCCLTLRNGFTVTGESACASPANFDAELGRKIARSKARDKIWALEGYLLRERLSETV